MSQPSAALSVLKVRVLAKPSLSTRRPPCLWKEAEMRGCLLAAEIRLSEGTELGGASVANSRTVACRCQLGFKGVFSAL